MPATAQLEGVRDSHEQRTPVSKTSRVDVRLRFAAPTMEGEMPSMCVDRRQRLPKRVHGGSLREGGGDPSVCSTSLDPRNLSGWHFDTGDGQGSRYAHRWQEVTRLTFSPKIPSTHRSAADVDRAIVIIWTSDDCGH